MRKNLTSPCLVASRESLEATVADIVRLKLEHARRQAAMEHEIASIQKKHQEGLLALDHELQAKEAGVYVFCQANRRSLFPDKKSMDLLMATVGYELNPPSVEKLSKRDTWSEIATRLAALEWGQPYIIEPAPEISKARLLADRDKLAAHQLHQVGLAFHQEEQFFIRPKSEVAADTVKATA